MTDIQTESAKTRQAGKTVGGGKLKVIWLAAITAAFAALYAPTFSYMWERWEKDTQYSLAYLVPFVSGYFIWKQWKTAKDTKRDASRWGLALIVMAMLTHFAGTLLDVAVLSAGSIIACLVGCCLYLRGRSFTRIMWFPLAYTAFMVPLPEGITDMVGFPMQLWASASTAHLLGALGIEVVRNGVNMSVPGFDFEVAAACSGMSSLVALVGVSAVFAYITDLPAKFRWILFGLSLPIALAANVVRITTIALVGYWVGGDAAINIYHDWSSPILFVVAILLLFAISRGFEWLNARRTTH
ncbi:MAG: exosortase/archaeosortase family protein [Armatimonadota bacterium]|nr:exosortase/archaeosortase family protein [bacterium]